MKVYIIICEVGEHDDYCMEFFHVFKDEDVAKRYVEKFHRVTKKLSDFYHRKANDNRVNWVKRTDWFIKSNNWNYPTVSIVEKEVK